jgi:protein transport protein SEC24
MADGAYSQQGYGQPAPYAEQEQPLLDETQQPGYDARPGGKKKKDRYAGPAYAFGAAAAGGAQGQAPAAAASSYGQPAAPSYGGYGQDTQAAPLQPAYGAAEGYPAGGAPAPYGQPTTYGGAPVGGYQAPAPPAAQGYAASGVAAITQGMGQMGFGGAQRPAEPATTGAPLQLNRLQTTDLISQPFHVSELDMPPPSIILPPNVRPDGTRST